KSYIAGLQTRERQRTGIGSLKVGFNKVFGYYIEVTRPHLEHVPVDYERRQTLAGAERFVTPELKEYEARVLGAEERIGTRGAVRRARADGRVRPCPARGRGRGGPVVHAGRRLGQPGARPVHVHGGDERDERDPPRGERAQPRTPRRDRPRHLDLRRRGHRLGG